MVFLKVYQSQYLNHTKDIIKNSTALMNRCLKCVLNHLQRLILDKNTEHFYKKKTFDILAILVNEWNYINFPVISFTCLVSFGFHRTTLDNFKNYCKD